jgi:hypothetical protein
MQLKWIPFKQQMRRSVLEVPNPNFCKMALFAPNGLLVTRKLLLPETVKCWIGASGTERLKFTAMRENVNTGWSKSLHAPDNYNTQSYK